MEVTHQIDIAAPLSTIWSVTKDFESWPAWTPTVTGVRRLAGEGIELGARYVIKQPLQRPKVWEITEVEDGRSFCWETGTRFLRLRAEHRLLETEGETRNVLKVGASGLGARFIWPILRPILNYALKSENAGLKSVCETRVGRS